MLSGVKLLLELLLQLLHLSTHHGVLKLALSLGTLHRAHISTRPHLVLELIHRTMNYGPSLIVKRLTNRNRGSGVDAV